MHEGDTLSGIAQAHGVSDWHQVWDASKGMAEPSGQHLTDPDLIRPGWTVKIPESAQTPTTTAAPTTRRNTDADTSRHRRRQTTDAR